MARDVSDFLLVAPAKYEHNLPRLEAIIDAEMALRYPRFSFRFANIPDLRSDVEYGVIPLMGYASPEGEADRIYLCNPLPDGLIEDIKRDLNVLSIDCGKRVN